MNINMFIRYHLRTLCAKQSHCVRGCENLPQVTWSRTILLPTSNQHPSAAHHEEKQRRRISSRSLSHRIPRSDPPPIYFPVLKNYKCRLRTAACSPYRIILRAIKVRVGLPRSWIIPMNGFLCSIHDFVGGAAMGPSVRPARPQPARARLLPHNDLFAAAAAASLPGNANQTVVAAAAAAAIWCGRAAAGGGCGGPKGYFWPRIDTHR